MTKQQLVPNSTSTSLQIANIDRGLSEAVAAILNTADRVGTQTIVRRLPTPALKRQIEVRQADIKRALLPLDRSIAERDRAAKAIAAVLSGWVNAKVSDPAAKVAAYLAVLGDLPVWAVEEVCRDVARGHVSDIDPNFPPSAAKLHQLAEEVVYRLKEEAKNLEAVRTATLTAEPVPTPEERGRIAVRFQALHDELTEGTQAEFKARQRIKHELNREAFAQAQERTRREYAEMGQEMPSPLALSPTALKVMRDVDAERRGETALDRQGEDAA